MLGKEIRTETNLQQELSLDDLRAGCYFARLRLRDGNIATTKFVIP
jgi:hypothetical protein